MTHRRATRRSASTVVFLRHAECEGNVAGLLVPPADSPLTQRGRSQAEHARELLGSLALARVFTSPMVRARQTAACVVGPSARLPMEVVAGLRERSFGLLNAWTKDRMRASAWSHTRIAWNARSPDGETLKEVAVRAFSAISECVGDGPTLVVTHAGVMRAVVGVLDGLPLTEVGCLKVPHATPWHRSIDAHQWQRALARVRASEA